MSQWSATVRSLVPGQWGDLVWSNMFLTAENFPETPTLRQSRAAYSYFSGLGDLLPCPTCGSEYRQMMERPLVSRRLRSAVRSRESLCVWVANVRRYIDRRMGKPVQSVNVIRERHCRLIVSLCSFSKVQPPQPKKVWWGVAGLVCLVLIFWLLKNLL